MLQQLPPLPPARAAKPPSAKVQSQLIRVQEFATSGRTREAHALAGRIARDAPDVPLASYMHGCLCLQLSEPADAVPSFERALSLEASNWRSWLNLATCLLQLERAAEAVRAARRVTELLPSFVAGHIVLANAYRLLGARSAAVAVAREARRLERTAAPQPSEAAALAHEPPGLALGEILVDDDTEAAVEPPSDWPGSWPKPEPKPEAEAERAALQEAWALATEAAEAATAAQAAAAPGTAAQAAAAKTMALACTLAGRVQEAAGAYADCHGSPRNRTYPCLALIAIDVRGSPRRH